MKTNMNLTTERGTLTVKDVQEKLGIGRSTAYDLCNSGVFKTIRIGSSIRVVKSSFEKWWSEQTDEQ